MLLGLNATEWLILKNMGRFPSAPQREGGNYIFPTSDDRYYIPMDIDDDWDVFELQQAGPTPGGDDILPELPEMPPTDAGGKKDKGEEKETADGIARLGRIVGEFETNWSRFMSSLGKTVDAFEKLNTAASRFYSTLSPSISTLGDFVGGIGRAVGSLADMGGFFGSFSRTLGNIALGVSRDVGEMGKKGKEATDTLTALSKAFHGGGAAAGGIGAAGASGVIGGASAALVGGVAGGIVTGAILITMGLFFSSMHRVLESFSRLTQTFDNVTDLIESMTQFESAVQRLGLGLMRLPEYAMSSSTSIMELNRQLSEAGINIKVFADTLTTALGDIQRFGSLGFITFREWTETLSGLGRLGIRADQFREVLSAAAQGRILESGGLSLPREYVESIAALNYGILGLGESAGYAQTLIAELNRQQAMLAMMTDRASTAVQAYNLIMGALTESVTVSGRMINDIIGQPLYQLALVLRNASFGQSIKNIAEGIGEGIRGFIEGVTPYFQRFGEILNQPHVREALLRLQVIGNILGTLFGQLLTSIAEAIPSLVLMLQGFTDLWAGVTRLGRGIFDIISGLRIPQIIGGIAGILGWIFSIIGEILSKIGIFINRIVTFLGGLPSTLDFFLESFSRAQRTLRREETIGESTKEVKEETKEIYETVIDLHFASVEFKRSLSTILDAIIQTAAEASRQAPRFKELATALTNLYAPGGLPGLITAPFFAEIPILRRIRQSPIPGMPQQVSGTPQQEQQSFLPPLHPIPPPPPALDPLWWQHLHSTTRALSSNRPLGGGVASSSSTSPQERRPTDLLREALGTEGPIMAVVPYAETVVSGMEMAVQPVIASYAQLAGILTQIGYLQARLNEEFRGLGTTARTDDLIRLYTQLGETIRRIGESLKNVAQISEQFYRSWSMSYEVAASFLRLDLGSRAVARQLDLYTRMEDVLKNIVELGEYKIRQSELEVYRLSEVLGAYNVLLQGIVNAQAKRLGILPEAVALELMSPQDLIRLARQYQIPEQIIQPVMEQLDRFYRAQMNTMEALAGVGRELSGIANAMRSAAIATRDISVRFGDVNETIGISSQVLETFNLSLEGLQRRAAAALATYRLDEYFRSLEEIVQALNERYNQLIEMQTRTIAAMARPLDLTIERFSTMISMLDKIGASALTLPQIFQSIVPAANRLLQEIIAMADAWRQHPEILNRILAEAERVYNRVMDLIGRASAIVPVIPITEVIRLAQMPAMMPLEMLRRPAEALGPRYELAGVPLTPSYILAQQFWASGAWIQIPELREFMLRPLDVYRTVGGMGVSDINSQLAMLRQSLAEERALIQERIMTEAWNRRITMDQLTEVGLLSGRVAVESAIIRGGIGLPSISEWTPQTLRYIPYPPQPVKLRVELDSNEILLRIRFVTESGTQAETVKKIKLTAYNPQSEAMRENQ